MVVKNHSNYECDLRKSQIFKTFSLVPLKIKGKYQECDRFLIKDITRETYKNNENSLEAKNDVKKAA
jgi:hypothetical protein